MRRGADYDYGGARKKNDTAVELSQTVSGEREEREREREREGGGERESIIAREFLQKQGAMMTWKHAILVRVYK